MFRLSAFALNTSKYFPQYNRKLPVTGLLFFTLIYLRLGFGHFIILSTSFFIGSKFALFASSLNIPSLSTKTFSGICSRLVTSWSQMTLSFLSSDISIRTVKNKPLLITPSSSNIFSTLPPRYSCSRYLILDSLPLTSSFKKFGSSAISRITSEYITPFLTCIAFRH